MSSTNDQIIDQELVAYLDHEASPEERAEIEAKLAGDASYRERLRRLQLSWDLLDELPQAEVGDGFAKSTVTMVAVRTEKDVQSDLSQAILIRRRRQVTWAGLLVVALAGGFLALRLPLAVRHRQELRDLPVIQNMDPLRHAESVSFLRSLDQEGLFELAGEDLQDVSTVVPTTEIASIVEEMSVLEREGLQKQRERFEKLPAEQQNQLRELFRQLETSEDGARLRRVMESYYQWRSTLSASEQADIDGSAGEARVEQIRSLQAAQRGRRIREISQGKISPEDAKEILQWLDEQVTCKKDQIVEKMPPEMRRSFDESRHSQRKRMMLFAFAAKGDLSPDPAALEELRTRISEPAQQQLEAAGDAAAQLMVVRQWLRASASHWWRSKISSEEMHDFWEELPKEERQRLEQLSKEEIQQVLSRMLFEKRRRGHPDQEHGWPGRRPGGPPPPPLSPGSE